MPRWWERSSRNAWLIGFIGARMLWSALMHAGAVMLSLGGGIVFFSVGC